MNANLSVSAVRIIDDAYITVNASIHLYGDERPLAERAAALETFVAGLPGRAPSEIGYGEPGGVLTSNMAVSITPTPDAGALVDGEVPTSHIENHVTKERQAIGAV